jgi:hypothetical protein
LHTTKLLKWKIPTSLKFSKPYHFTIEPNHSHLTIIPRRFETKLKIACSTMSSSNPTPGAHQPPAEKKPITTFLTLPAELQLMVYEHHFKSCAPTQIIYDLQEFPPKFFKATGPHTALLRMATPHQLGLLSENYAEWVEDPRKSEHVFKLKVHVKRDLERIHFYCLPALRSWQPSLPLDHYQKMTFVVKVDYLKFSMAGLHITIAITNLRRFLRLFTLTKHIDIYFEREGTCLETYTAWHIHPSRGIQGWIKQDYLDFKWQLLNLLPNIETLSMSLGTSWADYTRDGLAPEFQTRWRKGMATKPFVGTGE